MAIQDDPTASEAETADESGLTRREVKAARSEPRYLIHDQIGYGGMGEVVAATDEQLGREVAIKRLRAWPPTSIQIIRFLREARVQARLDHPAIVPVHELGRDERGMPYIVMKRVAGTTLGSLLRTPTTPLQRLLRAFVDVCLALEYAHVHGVVHRDVKPDNIVLGDFGEVYVLDWGVAKVVGESDAFADGSESNVKITQNGAVVGTTAYMSPEQARDSASVDAQSDVFSLGRMLAAILVVFPPAPPELAAIARAATEIERGKRIASARDLGNQVQHYLDGDRDLELRRKLAREQLEHAQNAFAAGLADEDRKVAIRAASSAMALDPTLSGASQLVGRLMLEPPHQIPVEVDRELAIGDLAQMKAQQRASSYAIGLGLPIGLGFLLLMKSAIPALLFGGCGVATILISARMLSTPQMARRSLWVINIGNALMIGVIAYLFTPLFLAPAIAAIAAAAMSTSPYLGRRGVAVLGGMLAVAVMFPAVTEQLGWGVSSIQAHAGGFTILSTVKVEDWMITPLMVLYVLGIITAAFLHGRFARNHEREARRQLQLHAWQLRQLVADPLAAEQGPSNG